MDISFSSLPTTVDQFRSMPEFGFGSPFQVAALTVVALTAFETDREQCYQMIDALKGPAQLSPMDKAFIRDRMMGKAEYIAKAYFVGSTPDNGYTPTQPLTVTVNESPYSYTNEGYATLYIPTTGADSPRGIQLRSKASTGEWFLWDFPGLLADIRKPTASNPWA
ncbi:MAG: hypothetical protein Q4G30_05975 [Actinomycetaceae bacterium]|nr:hypothetical protein [Actinomycetaceae bacterium]